MDDTRPALPAAFFGHGSPLNTLDANAYTEAWTAYAATLPRPRAILVVSAHWYGPGTRVSAAPCPPSIHDFNGRFPRALFDFTYPARTDAALIERVVDLLAPVPVVRDATTWGIDHGAYSVLAHLFPAAAIPVVQLSIDRIKPPRFHYELAQRLEPLRDEGVFVMASGNIVHNLELGDPRPGAPAYDWAVRFDERVCELVAARAHGRLIDYHGLGDDARLSVPTPDHYLPLLYVLGLQRAADRVASIVDGIEFRAGSMRSLSIG